MGIAVPKQKEPKKLSDKEIASRKDQIYKHLEEISKIDSDKKAFVSSANRTVKDIQAKIVHLRDEIRSGHEIFDEGEE